jgi:hypothetical protein
MNTCLRCKHYEDYENGYGDELAHCALRGVPCYSDDEACDDFIPDGLVEA